MVAGAVASSRDAIALDGKSYQNWASLGLVYETLAQIKVEGALSAAKDAYSQAKVLAPSNPSVPLAQARLAVLEGDAKGALALADEAIALKQNYTDAYFLKAQIEVSQNDITGAIKSVEDATIIDPTNAGLYFQLGLLKYNVKDFRGAGIAFENAIRIVPDYANAKYFLGLSYDQLGMRKEAITVFEDIQKVNPDNAEINLILTNLKADKAPFAEAKPPVDTKPQSRKTLPVNESQ
jgi:tetratricopeptide (TPR) repeat protein